MTSSTAYFGLSAAQRARLARAVVGRPVTDAAWVSVTLKSGASGADVERWTLRYRTASGSAGRRHLVAKRCVWNGRSEAVHYRYLMKAGVPVPCLHAARRLPDGTELVILESLPRTGLGADREHGWRSVVSLLARFNATAIAPRYARSLYSFEQIGEIDGGLWISGYDCRIDDDLDGHLAACGVPAREVPLLHVAAGNLFGRVLAQPKGLIHQDFRSDNLGWTHNRLHVFDLHKVGLGPRCADIAPYLGLPDWSVQSASRDAVGTDGASARSRLVARYLRTYARHGGYPLDRETFARETTDLSWAHKVTVLGYLLDRGLVHRANEVVAYLRRSAGLR